MIGALAQLGLGFLIGFTGAVIPGPFTVFIVTEGLSSGNRVHGVLAALGHCVVEAGIILLIVLGFTTLADRTPLRLLNMAGGLALIAFGILAFRGRNRDIPKEASKPPMRSAFFVGITLSVLNGTIPLWWATVGLQQLMFALKSSALTGALLWVLGHWAADVAWYGFLGYSFSVGRGRFAGSSKRIVTVSSLLLVLVGTFFVCMSILG
jgi:threonine/homoserine/homoserine lactone efflux protein